MIDLGLTRTDFLIIFFIMMLLFLRLLRGMINGYIAWAVENVPFLGGKDKKMPSWKDALGVIAMKAAPSIGKAIEKKIEQWGKGESK